MYIREAMMMTASMSDSANNDYGYGIINAAAAIEYEAMSGLDDNNSIPSKYSIIKAYPNPFNPSLNIEITVDQRSHLKVDIFSYNGNYISTIFDQISDIRIQKFEWNPNNLPSGIYFVASYNNGQRNYKKVTYIK